ATRLAAAPHRAPRLAAAPQRAPRLAAAPDRASRLAAAPQRATRLAAAPERATRLAAAPHRAPRLAAAPQRATRLAAAPQRAPRLAAAPRNRETGLDLHPREDFTRSLEDFFRRLEHELPRYGIACLDGGAELIPVDFDFCHDDSCNLSSWFGRSDASDAAPALPRRPVGMARSTAQAASDRPAR